MDDIPRLARLLAFYLPQYHPIPENDQWWGPGFTEWTNVVRARPLFRGHLQPHLPSELGFYDLRVPETRLAQAELARAHGIEAFCYWHYWFAGKRLLERPFAEVLASGAPDFPFCLGWANQTWSGIWHGAPGRLLIEQTYPGEADDRAHFEALRPAYADRRYLTVEGRPLFLVYRPAQLPDQRRFTDLWRDLAARAGLPGLFLVGQQDGDWRAHEHGFDARVPLDPPKRRRFGPAARLSRFAARTRRWVRETSPDDDGPEVFDYPEAYADACTGALADDEVPLVISNWDNTPRCGRRGYVLANATPGALGDYLRRAISQVAHRPASRRLVLLKSWNEWAEGNYLEPDEEFGRQRLECVRDAVTIAPSSDRRRNGPTL
jgi:hypothetical protein